MGYKPYESDNVIASIKMYGSMSNANGMFKCVSHLQLFAAKSNPILFTPSNMLFLFIIEQAW